MVRRKKRGMSEVHERVVSRDRDCTSDASSSITESESIVMPGNESEQGINDAFVRAFNYHVNNAQIGNHPVSIEQLHKLMMELFGFDYDTIPPDPNE